MLLTYDQNSLARLWPSVSNADGMEPGQWQVSEQMPPTGLRAGPEPRWQLEILRHISNLLWGRNDARNGCQPRRLTSAHDSFSKVVRSCRLPRQ